MNKFDQYYENIKTKIYDSIKSFPKQNQIKIEKWIKKFDEPVKNKFWKKNRNLYIDWLYDSLNNPLNKEFKNLPDEKPLPILNKQIVYQRLTKKDYLNSITKSPINKIKNKKKKISRRTFPQSLIKSSIEEDFKNSLSYKNLENDDLSLNEMINLIDSLNEFNVIEIKKKLKSKIDEIKKFFIIMNNNNEIDDLIKETDFLIEENKKLIKE